MLYKTRAMQMFFSDLQPFVWQSRCPVRRAALHWSQIPSHNPALPWAGFNVPWPNTALTMESAYFGAWPMVIRLPPSICPSCLELAFKRRPTGGLASHLYISCHHCIPPATACKQSYPAFPLPPGVTLNDGLHLEHTMNFLQ